MERNYDTEIENIGTHCIQKDLPYRFAGENLQEFAAWKEKTRTFLKTLLGLGDYQKVAPLANCRQIIAKEGYTQELWDIQTEANTFMPFYLLRPLNNGAQTPTIIIPHGHYPGGKESTITPTVEGRTFALDFVKKGYLVVCPDCRGAGERLRKKDKKNGLTNSHKTLANAYLGCGRVLLGSMIWDLQALLTYLTSLPEVDAHRIACVGMSGGGQQTLWLTALDERIKIAATSGYFYGYQEALLEQPGNCPCNFVPHLWGQLDMGDLGNLIAPRPFQIETGAKDGLNGRRGVLNVKEQVAVTHATYALWSAEEHLQHWVHPEGHVWVGAHLVEFVDEFL